MGKSRLAWEFAKYVEGLPQILYWRRGRSLAYGNVSYSALAEAVKAQCEVLEDDPPEVVAEKVDRTVKELFGDLEVAPHVRALVGARTEQRLSREELFDAWRRFLERMAARYPLVLALEDLHWADAGLMDFVDHLADWATGPILILTLARPELLETRPGWGGGKRNYAAIFLDPLSETECEAMVEDLLSSDLPESVKRLVAERSEGNPLYAEEIVRMLIDRGVLRATEAAKWELAQPLDEVEVPRSIHALIAARLDTLPAEEKALVQDAAVAGRIFWLGAAAALSERPAADVREALGRLRVKEIVTPREPPVFSGELEFAFRHVLIRDVAYESLPKLLRARKHVAVARWAEERAGDRGRELAEVVAAHYLRAIEYRDELGEPADRELDAAASRWAWEAGGRAWDLWQQEEAGRWFDLALSLGERSGADAERLAEIAEAAAAAADGLAPTEELVERYRAAIERYEALGRDPDVGRMQVAIGYAMVTAGRLSEAQTWVERGIAALERHGESADLAHALEILGNLRRRLGSPAGGEPPLRRSYEMAARVDAPVARGHAAISLGVVLLYLGQVSEGMALMNEGYEIASREHHLELLLRAHNAVPSTLMDYAPDYERGRRILDEGIELSRRSGRRDHEMWMWSNVGNYAFDLGRIDELELAGATCMEIGRSHSYPYGLGAGGDAPRPGGVPARRAGGGPAVRGGCGAGARCPLRGPGGPLSGPAVRVDRASAGRRRGGAAVVPRRARAPRRGPDGRDDRRAPQRDGPRARPARTRLRDRAVPRAAPRGRPRPAERRGVPVVGRGSPRPRRAEAPGGRGSVRRADPTDRRGPRAPRPGGPRRGRRDRSHPRDGALRRLRRRGLPPAGPAPERVTSSVSALAARREGSGAAAPLLAPDVYLRSSGTTERGATRE